MDRPHIRIMLILTILILSCTSDREWKNPYDPDSGTKFVAPEISSISAVDIDKLSIAWISNDENYTKILIERSLTSNNFNKIAEVDPSESPYTDTGLVFGNTYYYRILGKADEVEGSYSEIATWVLNLPAPTNLSAMALSDHKIQLTWNYSLLAKASSYWIPAPDTEVQNESSYKPEPEKMNRLVIKVNDDLISLKPKSETTPLKKLREKAISNLPVMNETLIVLNDSSTVMKIIWGQQGFEDGFIIERAEGTASYDVIDSVTADFNEYEDSNLSYGTTYKYRVCAYVDQYKSDYTEVESLSTTFPAPSNLSATATSDQSISLSWSDNCSFEEGYEVWRKKGSGTYEIIDSTTANGTAYDDSGLTYGESFSYKVRSFTELNCSNYSNEEQLQLIILSPTNLSATALNDHQIELSWIDNCAFEDGFEIKQREEGDWNIIDTLQSNVTGLTISYLTYGISYSYKIKAYTEAYSSDFSDTTVASTVFPVPSNLYILQSGDDAALSWSDNCTFESGYIIERSEDGGDNFTVIDTVSANSVDYTDSTISMYVDYIYRVKAFTEYSLSDYTEEVEFSLFIGNIIYVTPTGSDFTGDGSVAYPYKTVQKAIDMSTEGDMVLVADGTYNESINYSGKGITVASYFAVDADTSHSSATTISAVSGRVVYIDDDDAVLEGLTITNGSDSQGGGIYVTNDPLITDCVITGNSYPSNYSNAYGGGIYINGYASPEITNCVISNNEVISTGSNDYSYGGGVYCGSYSNVTFTNCQILNNTVEICNYYYAYGGGIYCGSNSTVTLNNCVVSGNIGKVTYDNYANGGGIYCDGSSLTINDSEISGNVLEATGSYADNAYGAGIYCKASLTIDNSTINNNYFEGDSYWDTKIGGGVYATSSVSISNCTIEGNGYEGVYSTSSNASFTNCTINNNGTRGLFSGTSSTFSQCTITNNGNDGIYAGSNSTFENIEVTNSGNDGIYSGSGSTFENIEVTNSGNDGIYSGSGSTFDYCNSSGNTNYGFYVTQSGFFTNCAANNNTVGGYYIGSYSSELINCLAVDNTEKGLYLMNSSTLIRNCTISGSTTGVYAGGNSGPAFMNVILYSNTTELDGDSDATMSFDYSDVQNGSDYGAWANGTGNMDSDPLFIGSGDYHLHSGSPCIDAGNPSATYNDSDGTRNDMGAYGGPNGE